jgi:MYXO-CTERM domain-containing protein
MLSIALASIVAAGPLLEVPWPCGETYSCTQGNGGATSHTGLAQYAWDFGMPLGTNIPAAHGGTVLMIKMNSNVGGCSNAYANDANYVLIDHGDGTAGLYLHVEYNSSNLQVGSQVAAGDIVARVGQTGWTCGPHLHFQVQEICGSWWCQSVPAEFYGAGTIQYQDQAQSENCGPCNVTLSGGQTTLSESEVTCFDRLTKYWWDAGEGLDGHHWFTYATAAPQPGTIGRWRFSVTTPGDYEVEVHIPSGSANSTGASYAIHHAGSVDQVGVNQAGQKGWQSLGTFYFDGGGDEYLELADNTGEPEGDLVPLAYDSVRFTYMQGGGDGDGDTGGDGDGDTGGDGDGDTWGTGDGDGDTGGECPLGQPGCMCTAGGGCDPGAICIEGYCTPDNSGESGGDTGGTSGDGSPFGDDGIDSLGEPGCACASDPAPGPLAWLLGPLALLGLGLRRRE